MKNNIPLIESLYSDCETDEERANFFTSGRAHETGIIAYNIQIDVARAFYAKAFVGEISYPENMKENVYIA
jgi:hypothetical protein